MKQRPRIYYTERQKALMWERWRKAIRCRRSRSYLIETIQRFKGYWHRLAESNPYHDAVPDWH